MTALLNFANAQFEMPRYLDVTDIKNRQPIVVVNPPNSAIVNRFSHKKNADVLQQYNELVDDYNSDMKTLVKKFWTFNTQEILVKTRAEINDMMKDKTERAKYFLIYCYSIDTHPNHDFDWQIDNGGKRLVGGLSHFAIGFPGVAPFYDYDFTEVLPTSTKLAYFISTANYKFNYVFNHKERSDKKAMMDDNMHLLGNKTLLLLKDDVNPKAAEDIGSWYPCKYKVVDEDEMESKVMAGDTNYAYTLHAGYFWIVNCADGAFLGYSLKGMDEKTGGMKKEFFLDIAEYCNAAVKK
ncbi:MAG TPA: hypothetical protein VK808_03985 [Bacteroidia bacterium]|nr:hypothetical protein [Bacteroidia bacterium]